MQSMVLSRESISSVYALVIPVSPLFATSSFTQSTGIHPDPVIGTALRRAGGASCIRLSEFGHADLDSREQQAILLKNISGNFQAPKFRFSVFPAKILARYCHAVLNFREYQGLPPN